MSAGYTRDTTPIRITRSFEPGRMPNQDFGLAAYFLLLLALLLALLAALAFPELAFPEPPLAGMAGEPPFAAASIRADKRDLIRAALLR